MNIIEKLVRAAWEAEKQEHLAREALNAAIREHRGKLSREEEAPITDPLLTALCEASNAASTAFKAVVAAWTETNHLPATERNRIYALPLSRRKHGYEVSYSNTPHARRGFRGGQSYRAAT